MLKILNVLAVYSILLSVFLFTFFENRIDNKKKYLILLFYVIIISGYLGVRDIGLDLEPHREFFNIADIISFDTFFETNLFSNRLEPIFLVMISILKKYNLGFEIFLFITGAIPLYIIFSTIVQKEKKIPIITFCFFLFLYMFRGPIDIIRHFFAATIYLSAIYSLSTNRKKFYYLKIAISVLIHYSNIAIFFLSPLLRMKWNIRNYIFTLFGLGILSLIGKEVLISNVDNSEFGEYYILWKLQYYLTYYNVEGYQYFGMSHKIILFIMNYFIVAFNIINNIVALYYRKEIEKDKFYHLLLNSQIIGSFLVVIFTILNAETVGIRYDFLFSIGSFFLAKEIIFKYYSGNKQKLYVLTMLSLFFYNFIVTIYYAGIHNPNSPFFIGF